MSTRRPDDVLVLSVGPADDGAVKCGKLGAMVTPDWSERAFPGDKRYKRLIGGKILGRTEMRRLTALWRLVDMAKAARPRSAVPAYLCRVDVAVQLSRSVIVLEMHD